jgi:hypothetical protein
VPFYKAQHLGNRRVEVVVDEYVIGQLHTYGLFFLGFTKTLMHFVLSVTASVQSRLLFLA